MKLFGTLACLALALALAPACACAAPAHSRLEGTWMETRPSKDSPRGVMHFKGGKVRLENIFSSTPLELDYKLAEGNGQEFVVSFEYRYKVKRGNGRIVDSRSCMDLRWHVEDGRPVLSEEVIEYDGRGLMIWKEFLRQEDFVDGFASKLKQRLDAQKPVPTWKEN